MNKLIMKFMILKLLPKVLPIIISDDPWNSW